MARVPAGFEIESAAAPPIPDGFEVQTLGPSAEEQGLSVEQIYERRRRARALPAPDRRDVEAEARLRDRALGVEPYASTPEDNQVRNRIAAGIARPGEEEALVERETRGERGHDYFANADAQPESVRNVVAYLGTVSHNLPPQAFPWLYHADGSRLSGQEIGDIVMRGHDRIEGMSPQQATLELFGREDMRPTRTSETAALGQHTPPPAFQADPLNADLENPATGGEQRERRGYQDFGAARPLTEEQRIERTQQRDFNREVIQQRLSRFGTEGPGFAGGMAQYLMGVSQRVTGGMVGALGTVIDDIGSAAGQDTSGAHFLQNIGRYMGERGLQRETAATPNYRQFSPEWYAFQGTEALVEMGGALAGSVATKNPALVTSTLMGLRVFAEQYDDSVRQGRTPNEALIDGTAYGMFEMIPENMALHEIWAPGQRFLRRAVTGVAAEGAQEMITEALQAGWDAGILNQQMTARQALERIGSAGLLGGLVGGPVGVGSHGMEHLGARRDAREAGQREIDAAAITELDPNKVDPSDPNNIASLRSRAGVETALPTHRPGIIEQAGTAEITPQDEASPIPTDLIAEGRSVIDRAAAGQKADDILDQHIGHRTGDRVSVTIGDQTREGEIKDAFTEDDPEQGPQHGAVIQWDHGGESRERFTDLHDAGARIERPGARIEGANAREIVRQHIARAENSTGNPNARNPRSSASGPYQFTDGTFRSYYQRVYGRDPGEHPPEALKNDRQVQDRLMDAMLDDNERALRHNRHPVTAGNLYLSHFLGPAGANAVLSNPNATVEQSVGARVIAANPFLRGMTGTDVAAWAEARMAGARYAGGGTEGVDYNDPALQPDFSWINEPLAPLDRGDELPVTPPATTEPVGDGTREAPVQVTEPAHLDIAAARVEQPTEAQAEAGNYRAGHIRLHGLDITIETPRGAERSGTGPDGSRWSVTMPSHYGYVKRTDGADGEQVDVYVGPHPASMRAYIVDQVDADTGAFDEHKIMLGYRSRQAALDDYHAAFDDGRGGERIGAVTSTNTENLHDWLKEPQTGPIGELGSYTAPEQLSDESGQLNEAQPSAEIGQFDPAPHIAALREYVANRARSLSSQAVGKALGVAPEQAQRVIGALAAQANSGIFVSKQGNVRRIPVREGPVSLYQFLKDRGGIVDNKDKAAGSRHALASGRNLTRFPGLINKGGMNLDDALEAAVEAGYFQTRDRQSYSTDDLLQKLENASREYIPGEQPEKKVDDSESVIRETAETFGIELSPEEIEVARAYIREGDVPLTAIDRATQDRTVGLFAEIADATGIEEYRETDEGDKAQGSRASDQEAAQGEPRLAGAEEAAAGKPAADAESDGAGENVESRAGTDRQAGQGDEAQQTEPAPSTLPSVSQPTVEAGSTVSGPQPEQIDAFGTQPGDERRALERAGEGRKKSAATQKAPGSEGGLFDQNAEQLDMETPAALDAAEGAKSEAVAEEPPAKRAASLFQRADPLDSDAFRRWFGDSKVVDENGAPLTVYHATRKQFDAFSLDKSEGGFFFAPRPQDAYPFGRGQMLPIGRKRIIGAYVSLQRPLDINRSHRDFTHLTLPSSDRATKIALREKIQAQGYDGAILRNDNGSIREVVAFEPTQIKSTDNTGAFDSNDSRHRYQRGPEIDRRTFIKGASAVAGGFMVGNRLFAQPPGLTSILERSMNEVVPLTEPLEWIANNSDNAQFRRFARRMGPLVNGIVVRGARQGETVHPDGTPVPEDMSEGLAHGMHQTDEVTDGDVIWLATAPVLPSDPAGQRTPGNIDIMHRPHVQNADGSISTVRSMSFGTEEGEVLIPTVSEDGRIMSDREAMRQYEQTGRHLGIFDTPEHADAYAEQLHNQQDYLLHPVNGFSEGTLIHEALHAAIYRIYGRLSMRMGDNDPALLQREGFRREATPRPASEAQIAELRGLYQDAVTAFENMIQTLPAGQEQSDRIRHIRNGIGNPDEFLSYALENHDMQNFLRSQPSRAKQGPKTLWDKVVDFVRRALGLGDSPRSALDDVLDTGYRLLADPQGPTRESNQVVENPTAAEFNRGSTTGRSALQASSRIKRNAFPDNGIETTYLTERTGGPPIPRGMNIGDYDLFARKVMLDELSVVDPDNLPFGFTEETLAAAQTKIDALVNKTESVREAVRKYHFAQMLTEAATAAEPSAFTEASQREPIEGEPPRAANVRMDKLESIEDIRTVLEVSADRFDQFKDARRGVVSREETQTLANDLDMTVEQLTARRRGQAFNAHELLASRQLLVASANDLVEKARQAEGGSDADLLAFRKAWVRHVAIQEQVSGMTAEAGRALNQFKMVSKAGGDLNARMMREIIETEGGRGDVEKVAKSILGFADDPAKMNRFARQAYSPTWRDKLFELWINGLLSGPATHAVNALSNAITAITQIPEFALASGIGKVRSLSKPETDRILRSEVGARVIGMIQGAKEGARLAAEALRSGEGSDVLSKLEARTQRAISGKKGEIIRIPSRLLIVGDELFKGMARRMELEAQAARIATREGLTGDEFKDRTAALVADPTEEMVTKAMDYARYSTFQRPLGEMGQAITHVINKVPGMRLIVPFIRTPANIFKFAIARTLAAPILKEVRDDIKAGGAARDLAVARIIIGTSLGATVMLLAVAGIVTGGDPDDDNARRLLHASGWQPYSVKIGDTYYSYQRLDPLATILGLAADLAMTHENMSEQESEGAYANLFMAMLNQLKNKTFLSGIGNLIEAIEDPGRFGPAFLGRLAGTVIPTGVAQLNNAYIDPVQRDARSILERIESRVPGLSSRLPPRRDIWGRVITREGGIGPDIASPIWTSTDEHDPVTEELTRAGVHLNVPSRRVSGIELTAEQYDRYQELAGEVLHRAAARMTEGRRWQRLNEDDRVELFDRLKDRVRRAVRGHLGLTKRRLEREQHVRDPVQPQR